MIIQNESTTDACCDRSVAQVFLFLFVFLLDVGIDFLDFVLNFLHPFLETLDAFTKAVHQLGNLLCSEEKKNDQHDDYKLRHTDAADKQEIAHFVFWFLWINMHVICAKINLFFLPCKDIPFFLIKRIKKGQIRRFFSLPLVSGIKKASFQQNQQLFCIYLCLVLPLPHQ